VHGSVLFEEGLALYTIGITFAREGATVQVGKDRRRDPRVIVDYVLLGKPGGGIKNLLQVRDLQSLALNFDG
jgi:hypothetical protein